MRAAGAGCPLTRANPSPEGNPRGDRNAPRFKTGRDVAALTLNALLCVTLFSQLYLFLRARRFIRSRRHLSPGQRRAAVLALAVFFGLMSLPYVIRLLSGRPSAISSPWFTYGVLYPFGVWSVGSMILGFFLGGASSLRWIASRVAGGFERFPPSPPPARTGPAMSRRSFLCGAASATAAVPLVLSAHGTVNARTDYETVEMDMPIRNLPSTLLGLRSSRYPTSTRGLSPLSGRSRESLAGRIS